ncbi:hypothetical protein [Actinocrispum sp. NPDC049592]|uniref:hypothetical protein n=1 Tax=Actinocrispum sp. NPDC049592 TaxID=3154835 RepID=UPI003443B606
MTDRIRNEMSGVARSVLQAGVMHVHQAPMRPDPAVVARPIGEWNPFDLDVHRAISTPADAQLPELPGYLRRDHDDVLAQLIADPQRSLLVVLTGGSSTGKTRALYEAVRELLSDWPLLYPRTSDTLLGLIQHERIKPRTVLWLNETQNHLSGPSGDAVAAWLRAVLDGSVPGPIVVLGTLWPQYWADLTTVENPHTRALLQHSVKRVRVAERFTPEQLSQVRGNEDIDPRLAAAAIAKDGHVIQTLAGGPALVERYEHPDRPTDRYAAAIISAAIDARRLGFRSLLPLALLADAASGYLSDEDRTDPPPDWFTQGLAQAAKDPVYGITALTGRRLQSGVGPPDGYDLHDYLDQHGQVTRQRLPAPESLWEALTAHATNGNDLVRLLNVAYPRLLYRYADVLLQRVSGDQRRLVAQLLVEYGRLDAAIAIEEEDPGFLYHGRETMVRLLLAKDRPDDALRLYLSAVERSQSYPPDVDVVDMFLDHGATEQALQALRHLAKSEVIRMKLARVLAAHQRIDELRERAGTGDSKAAEQLADHLADTGQWAEALAFVRGCEYDWRTRWLAERLAGSGRLDRLRELSALYPAETFEPLMAALLASGAVTEAMRLYDARTLEGLNYLPSERVVESLVAHGETSRVVDMVVNRQGPGEGDGSTTLFQSLIRSMRAHGRTDEAERMLRKLIAPGESGEHWLHATAEEQLLDLLADQGDWAQVLSMLRDARPSSRSWFVEKLADLGKLDQLRRLARTGNGLAQQFLVIELRKAGRCAEALDLMREFAEAQRGIGVLGAELLAERMQFAELRDRTARGDRHCGRQLAELAYLGVLPQAEQLLKYGLTVDGAISEG